jgi:hypothetical protein
LSYCRVDRQGRVTHEVTLARFGVPLPEHPGQERDLRALMIRDLCHHILCEEQPEEWEEPLKWDERPDGTHEHWLDAGWPRLQPFFQLSERVHWGSERVEVELKPFNDHALT